MRFFDETGGHIESAFDDRVLGISPTTLRAIPRRVAVAGGIRKTTAIKAALSGGWVHVLITDLQVARSLLAPAAPRRRPATRRRQADA
ncbi:sugar-binding domain-containing protein [Paractinoplanes rishiriensis]|uniref:Sugar-binding domain-containing protein n=1 Tax=Paractinoplanes rishiriensis TaxID=1050105 RepID=A0A919JXH7_9ACTN|nr:sugar-binding domain-containing protein [Actinoplanes rishiriensis]GIE94923.1 hypothetical protein Ari01nite_23880 [Actinoplanes rishiriensis]